VVRFQSQTRLLTAQRGMDRPFPVVRVCKVEKNPNIHVCIFSLKAGVLPALSLCRRSYA
jgi:hypothetical protein